MKVMCAPMKEGDGIESSLRFIKKQGPRLFSNTEMDIGRNTYLPVIHKVFGKLAKVFSEDKGGPKSHSQEIPIVLRVALWIHVISFTLTKLSDDVPGPGMGNDRWLAELRIKVFRKVWVIFATHTNAGVQHTSQPDLGKIRRNDRWPAFKQEIERMEAKIRNVIEDPKVWAVIQMGDMNMLPVGEGLTDEHSPHQMYERLGMKYTNTRVVYIAYWGLKCTDSREYPAKTGGWTSDHAALMCRLKLDKSAHKKKVAKK